MVGAWVHLDPLTALEAARGCDRRPVGGPLHGVPVAVRDVIDTADRASPGAGRRLGRADPPDRRHGSGQGGDPRTHLLRPRTHARRIVQRLSSTRASRAATACRRMSGNGVTPFLRGQRLARRRALWPESGIPFQQDVDGARPRRHAARCRGAGRIGLDTRRTLIPRVAGLVFGPVGILISSRVQGGCHVQDRS